MIRFVPVIAVVACGRLNFETRSPDDATADGSTPTATFRMVLGKGHGCGIRNEQLFCWGSNGSGQLGVGSFTPGAPQLVAGDGWTDVCAANDHTCGIRQGELYCWGNTAFGQLGNGAITGQETTPILISNESWVDVTCDDGFTCGLRASGVTECWGRNIKGELGVPGPNGSLTPITVATNPLAQISAGKSYMTGLQGGGAYVMWGSNEEGQRGDGTGMGIDHPPQNVDLGFRPATLSPGREHTCARSSTGAAFCWGDNRSLQVGTTGADQPRPVMVAANVDVIAAGGITSCAITNGRLSCWGSNEFGQLADPSTAGSTTGQSTPLQIGTFDDWATVALGSDHVCGERAGGDIYCWGQNDGFELGIGTTSPFEATVSGPLVFP